MVSFLLYWAEVSLPMGALLVLLLVISIVATWAIINLLRDDDALSGMFDD
jgi:hypothetical protein